MDDEAYCTEGCGQVATYERLVGVIMLDTELVETVELVCHSHRDT